MDDLTRWKKQRTLGKNIEDPWIQSAQYYYQNTIENGKNTLSEFPRRSRLLGEISPHLTAEQRCFRALMVVAVMNAPSTPHFFKQRPPIVCSCNRICFGLG